MLSGFTGLVTGKSPIPAGYKKVLNGTFYLTDTSGVSIHFITTNTGFVPRVITVWAKYYDMSSVTPSYLAVTYNTISGFYSYSYYYSAGSQNSLYQQTPISISNVGPTGFNLIFTNSPIYNVTSSFVVWTAVQ